MTALVAACVIRPDHGLARLLDGRAVRHVGAVSYGVYLVHVSMITAAKALLPRAAPTAAIFAIALGASIALATVSFRTIEAPLLRLRERLRARSKAMPDVAAPLQASDGTT
jgi:peptidoglycan/LPS O-acetylase OafA/YrhL